MKKSKHIHDWGKQPKTTKERMAPLNRKTCWNCKRKAGPWHTEYYEDEDLIVRVCEKCRGLVAGITLIGETKKPQTTCPGCGCVHGV